MKLKTELEYVTDSIKPSKIPRGSYNERTYDAAAAHALMQAIQEFWKKPNDLDSDAVYEVRWILNRADEIMREFGYEVES
jgi:hypothetical protein